MVYGKSILGQNKILGASFLKIDRFHHAAAALSEAGQRNIRVLRNWAKSKNYIKKQVNGGPEKWGLASEPFEWYLIIKPEPSGREGLNKDSNKPRFEARYKIAHNKYQYINPFTGQTGGKEIRHESLDVEYF